MLDECAARVAVGKRDMPAALDAMQVGRQHCFVWPDSYDRIYHWQRLSWCKDIDGFPVIMKSARTSIYAKHGKPAYVVSLFERFIRIFRVTSVERPASAEFYDFWQAMDPRHDLARCRYPYEYRDQIRDFVIVRGRLVPITKERVSILEKSIALLERLDSLAA